MGAGYHLKFCNPNANTIYESLPLRNINMWIFKAHNMMQLYKRFGDIEHSQKWAISRSKSGIFWLKTRSKPVPAFSTLYQETRKLTAEHLGSKIVPHLFCGNKLSGLIQLETWWTLWCRFRVFSCFALIFVVCCHEPDCSLSANC